MQTDRSERNTPRTDPSVATELRVATRRRRVLTGLLYIAGLLLLAEAGAAVVFSLRPHLDHTRQRLLGRAVAEFQTCTAQPYLLYVPTPGRARDGWVDHSPHGYRGSLVPMERQPGVARVLCLGGSTTYGTAVERSDETFAAQLEARLDAKPPPGYTGVEVLNGGAPYATSAENLIAYLLKFHYYRPDVVILHTGHNDGKAMVRRHYQPDYAHWRQQPCVVRPLPRFSRWTMHSRAASLAVITAVFGARDETEAIIRPDRPADVAWYPRSGPSEWHERDIPDEELGFRHNLEVLLAAIEADGGRVVLLPEKSNPSYQDAEKYRVNFERNERILAELAELHDSTLLAPIERDLIPAEHYADSLHVDATGHRMKAELLEPWVRAALTGEPTHRSADQSVRSRKLK